MKKTIQLSDLKLDQVWTRIRRTVLYGLYLLAFLLLQNVIFSHIAPLGVRAMFMPALVVAVALFEGGYSGGLFGLAAGIVCCAVLGLSLPASLLTLAVCAAFTVLTASAGLCLNLLSPNLSWTNETVPLKNSMPVFVMLFGSWGFLAAMAAGVYALSLLLSPALSLAAAAVLVALFAVLLLIWLRKKGTALYEGLEG